jgi:hypothetical protein
MRMRAGQPRAGHYRIAFDQPAGDGDQRTTPAAIAISTCRRLRLLPRLEQARTGLVARRMLRWFLPALLLSLVSFRAEAVCVDPAMHTYSTASIARTFDAEELKAEPDLLGIRGTGWFLSARSMVTVAHVALSMHLSAQDWKDIEIRVRENKQSIPVRLLRLLGDASSERIAVLELKMPFPGVQSLQIRTEPLVTNERVMSVAYPGDRLRVADGRFMEHGTDDKFAGTALLELYDGNDRLALDHGASGAPVLDCNGRVVAVVSHLLTRTMQFLSRVIRISTAWGNPNVMSVPIQVLKDFTPIE